MKLSIAGLIGLFSTTILGAPGAQPLQGNDLSGNIQARQSDFIEYWPDEPPFFFYFDTTRQHDENWIGIYPADRGPKNGHYTEDSILWRYVPDAGKGKPIGLTMHAHPLMFPAGEYEAYLLSAGGYEVLAGPAKIQWEAPSQKRVRNDVSFIPTGDITLANARVGDKYEYSVQGLLRDASDVSFTIEGNSWASINDKGLISGTPQSSGDTKLNIAASSGGASSSLSVIIPVVAKDSRVVSELSVMTYNLWEKGEHVNDHHAKQVAFLAGADVDIVGLQETDPERTKQLADALWWWYYAAGDRTGIISRYPITAKDTVDVGTSGIDDVGISVTVDLGDSKVHLWNVHLSPFPYGPYNACFENMTAEAVIEGEEEKRLPEIRLALEDMEGWYDDAPVILVGDFNAPSHLDWTEETSKDHCDVGPVEWPSSKAPIEAGLKDAWRELYPKPEKDSGNTWSPIWNEQEFGKEPQDRIDFIYYHNGLRPKQAGTMMVGEPKLHGNHADNEWTSDHKAVRVIFGID